MRNVDNTLSDIKILATLTKYKDNLAILKKSFKTKHLC